MFTGIIKTTASVENVKKIKHDLELTIKNTIQEKIHLGDSICVNGACLTVIKFTKKTITFYLSKETLSKITPIKTGSIVNIETSLKVGDMLGGHFVTGHVDGISKIKDIIHEGSSQIWKILPPKKLLKYFPAKGSVTLNGISLTINNTKKTYFEVNLIPHTVKETNLQFLKHGDFLNTEVDILARYSLKEKNDS